MEIVKIAKPYRNEFLFFKTVTTKYLFVSTLVINAFDKYHTIFYYNNHPFFFFSQTLFNFSFTILLKC